MEPLDWSSTPRASSVNASDTTQADPILLTRHLFVDALSFSPLDVFLDIYLPLESLQATRGCPVLGSSQARRTIEYTRPLLLIYDTSTLLSCLYPQTTSDFRSS